MSLRTDLTLPLIKRSFDKRFRLARLTRLPGLGKAMDYALFRGDDIIILPKDQVYEEMAQRARTISMDVQVEKQDVMLPSQVIEHFLDRSRYIFLMDKCVCRDSNHCKNYPATFGCIFLGKGTKRISGKLGKMITGEEAKEHLRRCREAGLVHLIGRDRIDSAVFNTGPAEDLLSICSCCPCCCLWKMVPDLSGTISGTLTAMPGVEIVVHEENCVGCGLCIKDEVCYVKAMSLVEGKVRIDPHLCKGCARCVERCKHKAIELRITDPTFMERTIERLDPLVDVQAE